MGCISIIGWFWFSGETFAAAWNPKGLSLREGMGSSIALTLWAFLGMESAAQNSAAVENPKRDVPLACMFGTLGAAVIYILSTTVIQGIVPNAELANSTGPFGLAYAQMFNPTVGSIVMALAAMACVGSLLGWQFTLAQTAKAAADSGMFPAFFWKVNQPRRADHGHDRPGRCPVAAGAVHDLAQPERAVQRAGQPGCRHQRRALHHRAVRSAGMMQGAGVDEQSLHPQPGGGSGGDPLQHLCSVRVGQGCGDGRHAGDGARLADLDLHGAALHVDAVRRDPAHLRGEMNTQHTQLTSPYGHRIANFAVAILTLALLPLTHAAAGTLDRVREAAKLTLGYRADARPFSYRDESGNAAGYSVTLCQRIADEVKAELGLSKFDVKWVPVTIEDRFLAVQQGRIDLLCGTDGATLERRKEIGFSIPIFPGGIGVILRADAPVGLKDVLAGRKRFRLTWRASPAEILRKQTFSVVAGSTSESWLASRREELQIDAKVVPVESYDAGIRGVLGGSADVFFAERALLLDAEKRSPSAGELIVLDRRFTYEPLALALQRGDEDFRLLVDGTLSRLFGSNEFADLYTNWFGEIDEDTLRFFQLIRLPE